MVNNRSFLNGFLVSILIYGLFFISIVRFGTVWGLDGSSFGISGYILDSDGNGVAGANIIFNVPDIVPSVYSDASGYFAISAPAGTYHVNVWPPFDSNYIYYDEPAFVVASDVTKNITLNSGYKISGYITDSSGTPVIKAVVSLNNFLCGWYSTYSGYYFVTAPAGTYTLKAGPTTSPVQDVTDFSPYQEYNVVVNDNLEKNITVSGSSPSPSPPPNPSPSPNTARSQISISTDASSLVVGSAVNVNGRLSSLNGSALEGKTVILSYAVGNTASFIPIGSAITNDAGEYNIQWVNDASGTFTLNVEWTEDVGYQETTNTTSLSFLPYDGQNFFHVESNSTVSALAFNSTTAELSFAVTGPDGTAGYVKATIAKNLISDPANTKVYIDGNQLDYEVASTESSWILTFYYQHSTHQLTIEMAASTATEPAILGVAYWVWAAAAAIGVAIGIVGITVWRKNKDAAA